MLALCSRQPPFDPNLIYANVILLFFCGLGMGFNFGRRFVAFAHALQLLCCAVYFYTNESLQYRYWVKVGVKEQIYCIPANITKLKSGRVGWGYWGLWRGMCPCLFPNRNLGSWVKVGVKVNKSIGFNSFNA